MTRAMYMSKLYAPTLKEDPQTLSSPATACCSVPA